MSIGARETALSREELQRYSRHLILPEVGVEGQRKLRRARVLLVGAGGLGSPLGLYLAAAGIGTLGVVDDDVVDETNLQRQVIHDSRSVGEAKTESAAARITALNPNVEVVQHRTRIAADNALELVSAYDVVVDGSDNFSTRFCISDACVIAKKPNVYGSVYRFEGQASVFDSQRGPCYRCIFPVAPPPGEIPSCAEGGVLGVLPGIIGLIQATETIKLLLGIGEPLIGRLLVFDALDMRFRTLKLLKDENCPACGPNATLTEVRDEAVSCAVPEDGKGDSIDVEALHARLVRGDRIALLDVREPAELEIAKLDGVIAIPLDELSERLSELPKDEEIVVYCLTGNRSARATRLLHDAGFVRVRNLEGGIRAWTDRVDPSLTRY